MRSAIVSRSWAAACALIVASACSCASGHAGRRADTWRPTLSQADLVIRDAATELEPARFAPVRLERVQEIEARLAETAWTPVSPEEAGSLAPARASEPGQAMYLVRAVMSAGTEATGSFHVAQAANGDVFVWWGCLASHRGRAVHWPLVVALSREPARVLATTSCAR